MSLCSERNRLRSVVATIQKTSPPPVGVERKGPSQSVMETGGPAGNRDHKATVNQLYLHKGFENRLSPGTQDESNLVEAPLS